MQPNEGALIIDGLQK